MHFVIVSNSKNELQLITTYLLEIVKSCCINEFIDPKEALDYLRDHRVDVVISDLVMPSISGMDLKRQLIQIRPLVKIFFIKNRTGQEVAEGGVKEELFDIPLDKNMLKAALARIDIE